MWPDSDYRGDRNQTFLRTAAELLLPRDLASTFNRYRPAATSFSGMSRVSPYVVQWVGAAGVRQSLSRALNTSCPLSDVSAHRRLDLARLLLGDIVVDFGKNCQRVVRGERPAAGRRARAAASAPPDRAAPSSPPAPTPP